MDIRSVNDFCHLLEENRIYFNATLSPDFRGTASLFVQEHFHFSRFFPSFLTVSQIR